MAAAVMPLWFWNVWQIIGLGLMVFGAGALLLALRENKKSPAGRKPGQSKKQYQSTASIAEKKGNVK